eukprot:563663-Rhodomonas_salina.2
MRVAAMPCAGFRGGKRRGSVATNNSRQPTNDGLSICIPGGSEVDNLPRKLFCRIICQCRYDRFWRIEHCDRWRSRSESLYAHHSDARYARLGRGNVWLARTITLPSTGSLTVCPGVNGPGMNGAGVDSTVTFELKMGVDGTKAVVM